jgi:hypothetical protein
LLGLTLLSTNPMCGGKQKFIFSQICTYKSQIKLWAGLILLTFLSLAYTVDHFFLVSPHGLPFECVIQLLLARTPVIEINK